MGKSGLNKFIYLLQASLYFFGRDAGVVERGGLENRCSACGTESSNLSLSAQFSNVKFLCIMFMLYSVKN